MFLQAGSVVTSISTGLSLDISDIGKLRSSKEVCFHFALAQRNRINRLSGYGRRRILTCEVEIPKIQCRRRASPWCIAMPKLIT